MQATIAFPRSVPLRWGIAQPPTLSKRIPLLRVIGRVAVLIVGILGFSTIWRSQCRLATILLLALAMHFGVWIAAALMVVWGLAWTHVYEIARRRGLRDPIETPKTHKEQGLLKLLAWVAYGVKVLALDAKQVLYAKATTPLIRLEDNGRLPRNTRWVLIAGSLFCFGIIATHHTLEQAGLPEKYVYRWNMVGRVAELPMKAVEAMVSLSFLLPLLGRLPFLRWL